MSVNAWFRKPTAAVSSDGSKWGLNAGVVYCPWETAYGRGHICSHFPCVNYVGKAMESSRGKGAPAPYG
jgi:hypothetical protein